jgi:hypothetical protein
VRLKLSIIEHETGLTPLSICDSVPVVGVNNVELAGWLIAQA